MASSQETLKLIEKCIAMKEDRILRGMNNDPVGYFSVCSALGLLETHLGLKTPGEAKAAAAERFIALHYRLLANQGGGGPFACQLPQANDTTGQVTTQDPVNRAKVSSLPQTPGTHFDL